MNIAQRIQSENRSYGGLEARRLLYALTGEAEV